MAYDWSGDTIKHKRTERLTVAMAIAIVLALGVILTF